MKHVLGAAVVSLAVMLGGNIRADADIPLPSVEPKNEVPTLVPLVKRIAPSIVSIEIRGRVTPDTNSSSRKREIRSAGSGVVYDARRGLIITNNHVIEHADEITVIFSDDAELQARRVGGDPDIDVAIIRVPLENMTSIPFADSDRLEVGEYVLAVGNPMQLGQTVTSGIVSGLHRSNVGLERYEDFIQTDAAIYPGNSGGALVNLRGEFVGITTAFVGASTGNPGVGFAIPMNLARSVAEQILEFGEIHRGRLGITFDDPTPSVLREIGLTTKPAGPVILKVDAGSAAERAGLKPRDVVMEIGGRSVRNVAELRNRLALIRVGDIVDIAVMRDGKPMMIRATIA
jgi:S1-C subfamily serine protease